MKHQSAIAYVAQTIAEFVSVSLFIALVLLAAGIVELPV